MITWILCTCPDCSADTMADAEDLNQGLRPICEDCDTAMEPEDVEIA